MKRFIPFISRRALITSSNGKTSTESVFSASSIKSTITNKTFIAKKIKTKSLASSKIRKSKRISGDELAFVMTQTGGRPDFLYADSFRVTDVAGEPYSAAEMAKLVNFIELFCYLIREKGGIDQVRASLSQFEMREDGTIQREWLEDWIDFQTDQQLEWEQIEKIVDGADMASRGIVDIEQTISFIYNGMQQDVPPICL